MWHLSIRVRIIFTLADIESSRKILYRSSFMMEILHSVKFWKIFCVDKYLRFLHTCSTKFSSCFLLGVNFFVLLLFRLFTVFVLLCIISFHFCCLFIILCVVHLSFHVHHHSANAKCVFNAITTDTHTHIHLCCFIYCLILSLLIIRDTLAVSQAFRVYVASITTKLSQKKCGVFVKSF